MARHAGQIVAAIPKLGHLIDGRDNRPLVMAKAEHFEINADDPERAVKFYEGVFGWQIRKWEGPVDYWLIKAGEEGEPGIGGAIMDRMEQETTINTIDVPSVDELARTIEGAGGKGVVPSTAVPGAG